MLPEALSPSRLDLPLLSTYTFNPRVNATLAKLKECPKPPWQPPWPPGTKQPFTPQIAQRFFDLLSTSDCSLLTLLRDNPELPPYRDLNCWRCNNKNNFGDLWRKAREAQAEFLIQKALDLQKSVTPQTAHVVRVRFDILRYIAARFHPEVYGDKPQQPAANHCKRWRLNFP